MPISNYVPTSAIARPGVCTSSTRPASPYEGQVIYETDTDRTLVWNGSGWVFLSTSTANPVGMELVNSWTVGSGVTIVTLTNAFPSGYDAFRLVWTGGTMTSSSGDSQLSLQVGNGGTWLGNNYYQTLNYVLRASNTTARAAGIENGSSFAWVGGGSTALGMMDVTLESVNLSTQTFVWGPAYCAWPTAGFGNTAGFINTSTAYADARIIVTGTGTMSNGKIYSYGHRTP